MAADEDMMEGSVPSVIPDSPQQSEDVPSVEDLAWADSCLIKEHEVSDEVWSSLKDALLGILSSEPESVYSTAAPNDGSLGIIDIEVLPSVEEAGDLAHANEVKSATDDAPIDGAFKTRNFAGNIFLPNYVEEQEDESVSSRRDSGISADVSDQSSEEIFRVWDLDIPVEEEEDELVKQLNKALTSDLFESIPPTRGDSEAWEDPDSESIDDLIAGIADLSLASFSS